MGTLDGDGSLKIVAGCLTGRHSRKPRTPAVNSFDVVTKPVVRDAANARKPNLLALGCATVKATATSYSNSQNVAYGKF